MPAPRSDDVVEENQQSTHQDAEEGAEENGDSEKEELVVEGQGEENGGQDDRENESAITNSTPVGPEYITVGPLTN